MPRIAVFDDDADLLLVLGEMLEDEGWDVTTHSDIDTALAMVKRERPDLIIMDILVGPIASWETLELLVQDPATRSIPIIACSGARDQLEKQACWLHEHGIETLEKPFDIDELYSRVEAALRRSPAGDRTESVLER